jgi:hypothetical protein
VFHGWVGRLAPSVEELCGKAMVSVREEGEVVATRIATPSASAGRRVSGSTVADVVVCLGLIVAALLFTGKHVSGHHQTSPYDEYVYIDYYARVLDEGVVREGAKTEDYARRYLSCHPNRVFGAWQPQLCPERRDRPDDRYPMAGHTTAGLYPPVYFLSLRLAAQPLLWMGVDFVQAGRYAGGLWLALAGVLLYLALRRLKVHLLVAASVVLMMVSSTIAYWANTYISTDGAALASGAAMLYLAVVFAQHPTRAKAIGLIVVSAIVSLLKIQNLEAAVVAGGYLVLLAAADVGGTRTPLRCRARRLVSDIRTRVAVASVAAGVVAQGLWLMIRAAMSIGPDPDMNVAKQFAFPFDFLRDMLEFLPGVAAGGVGGNELGQWSGLSIQVLTLVIAGGVIGLALRAPALPTERALGVSVLVTSLLAGPALSLATLAMNGSYVPVVLRYGAPLLPGMLACFALLVPRGSRFVRLVIAGVAVFLYAAGLAFAQ